MRELAQVLRDLPNRIRDEGIGALVVTGAGDAFCAGADLKERPADRAAPGDVLRCDYNPVFVMLRNSSIPVVTAVHGPAIGIGMALAMLGDLCFATRDAYFHAPFSRFSLASEGGVSYLLPRMVGYRRALEYGGGVVQPQLTFSYDPFRFTMSYSYIEASGPKGASGVSLLRDRDNVLFQVEYVL